MIIKVHSEESVIIAVYGPSEETTDGENDDFYVHKREISRKIRSERKLIIIGDLNGNSKSKINNRTVKREKLYGLLNSRIVKNCRCEQFLKYRQTHAYRWGQHTEKLKSMLDLVLINKKGDVLRLYRVWEIWMLDYKLKTKLFKYINGFLETSRNDLQTTKNYEMKSTDKKNSGNTKNSG
jgi:hypothetical protein